MEKKKIMFSVGEKYRGLANGEVFIVQKVIEAGSHKTPSGGLLYLPQPRISFIVGRGRELIECPLAVAENLRLEKILPVAAPVPDSMRLPTCAEWNALMEATGGENDTIHWDSMYSWCADEDPAWETTHAVRGLLPNANQSYRYIACRDAAVGFRPVFEAADLNFADGTAAVVGTLYMGGQPVKVPQNPVWDGDVQDYVPGAALELREPLENPAYQVRAIKLGNLLISDRNLLKNISWDDIQEALGKKRSLRLGAMRLPAYKEWDMAAEAAGGSNDILHWQGIHSWVQNLPCSPGMEKKQEEMRTHLVRGGYAARSCGNADASIYGENIGFRPAIEILESNLPDGAIVTAGTLYMNGMPVKVPLNATCNGDIPSYIPGARLELREAVDDPAYQVQAIKAGNILLADRNLLKNISWNDLAAQGCVR